MKKYITILLIFFLLFSFASPAFAEDYLPPIVSDYGCDSYYIFENATSYGTVAFSSSDWIIFYQATGFNGGTQPFMIFYPKVDSPSLVYSAGKRLGYYDPDDSNNGWGTLTPVTHDSITRPDGSTVPYYHLNFNGGSIYSSTVNIPYGEMTDNNTNYVLGDVFFSAVPPLEVVTGEALTLFQSQTIQTIMIIVLCGVSCLALLISLPLLKRVFLQFLNR